MPDRLLHRPGIQALLIVLVGAAVYLPYLGHRPFDNSEGHRVVPGWTMLESGDWWHVKMFGLTYLRKPPGMPWAIAASSWAFGESTVAARLPSALAAIVMALTAWWFALRWFGSPWGLAAGLAQALMPLMWSPGRTAEIEMLNNLGAQWCAFGVADMLLASQARLRARASGSGSVRTPINAMFSVLLASLGIIVAAIAKGPASVPVLLGVLAAGYIVWKSAKPLFSRGPWIAIVLAAALLVPLGLHILRVNGDADAVRENIAKQFLWSRGRALGVLTLVPIAFASALPVSMTLLFPFGRGAKIEAERSPEFAAAHTVARLLAWGWLCAVLVLAVCGVSDARYAMPAAACLPPIVAYAARGIWRSPGFDTGRRSLGRWLFLGTATAWAVVLLLASSGANLFTSLNPTADQLAGREAAARLAGLVHERELWADDAIEARPDLLWDMQTKAPGTAIRWAKPLMLRGELPPVGSYLLLRTDPKSGEASRYDSAIRDGRLVRLGEAKIREYQVGLFVVQAKD